MSSVRPVRSSAAILAFASRQSSGKSGAPVAEPLSGAPAQVIAFPRRDVMAFCAAAPEHWRAFLHAHFDDHVEVALFFRVSDRGAEKWWRGDGGAKLDKFLIALHRPGALAWWLDRLPGVAATERRAA